jgi:capsular exopolysaccharide synthesis family protein
LFLYVIIGFISGVILSSFWIILQTQLKGIIIDDKQIINEELCPTAKTISISYVNKRQQQRYKMQSSDSSNLLYQFIQSSKMEDEFRYLAGRFCSGGFLDLDSSKTNCYCVTSSIPKEGKTTIAANLAYALACVSKKVIIVDCQKITPAINELFGLEMNRGLVEYMENPSQNMLDIIIVQSATKNLSIISYGNPIKENANLFYEKEFNFLLRELKRRFEHVILDCPPILESAESLSIAIHPEVDGVILVVQANRARKADLLKTCSYIESVNTKLLAVICNKI